MNINIDDKKKFYIVVVFCLVMFTLVFYFENQRKNYQSNDSSYNFYEEENTLDDQLLDENNDYEEGNYGNIDYEYYVSKYIDVVVDENANIFFYDDYDNPLILLAGFKFSRESGTSISEGIVIEDNEGNQFVWIPTSGNLVSESGALSNKLNRYINYKEPMPEDGYGGISEYYVDNVMYEKEDYYEEFSSKSYPDLVDDTNTYIAKDIDDFKISATIQSGFYVARYVAKSSDAGGIYFQDDLPSIYNTTQSEAAVIARNYANTSFYQSDLMNSYAYDSMINYILELFDNDNSITEFKKISLLSYEWTTETNVGFDPNSDVQRTTVARDFFTRKSFEIDTAPGYVYFRTILYVK
ncbi:MAG: hypothetical protein R3Y13_01930 [bacterium]